MKRWFLATAALLGGTLVAAHADYVRITVSFGPRKNENKGLGMAGQGMMVRPGMGMAAMGGQGGMANLGAGGRGRMPMGMAGQGGSRGLGMMGIGGAAGGASKIDDDADLTSVRAEIVVEVEKYIERLDKIRIRHKWGTTTLVKNDMFDVVRINLPTVAQAYHKLEQYKKVDKTAEDYLFLADWALQHGLLAQFKKHMEGLAKANPTHPASMAYAKVKADMERPITKADQANDWINRLDRGGTQPYQVQRSDHYALLYSKNVQPAEAKRRLDLLEKNYRAFFDWFVLQGKALPVPDDRLVAVLVERPDQFSALNKDFGPVPLAADGFYAQRYNLAVFSAERLDDAYVALHKATQAMWTSEKWNREKLLHGKGGLPGKTVEEFREAQMKALVLTAMEEESEVNSVSFEGSRQLLAATGLLPRKVHVPQWLSFGLGSFFETPRGAYWQGTGAPSWRYLKKYKIWEEFKELDKPEDALRSVVSDHYFHVAQEKKDEAYLLKGRTMSWALAYFLMKNHPDGVLRYCQELNNLPRDLEFDEKVLAGCFTRAFGLAEAARPNDINAAKFRDLAFEWADGISKTPLEDPQALPDAVKQETERRKKAEEQAKPPSGAGQRPLR